MQGKTHIAVGAALGAAVMMPDSMTDLAAGLAVCAAGSILSDIDAGPSGSRNGAVSTGAVILILLSCLYLADSLMNLNLLTAFTSHIKSSRLIIALPAFILLCSLGILSGHRTFTHSTAAMALYTSCVYVMLPGYWLYFLTGFASHLFLDSLNYRGIMLFYPLKTRFSFKACHSDGIIDTLLFAAGVICLILLVYESAPVRSVLR